MSPNATPRAGRAVAEADVRRLLEPVEESAGGATRSVPIVSFLRSEAGNYALRAQQETDFRLRALAQSREKAFDRIADAVESIADRAAQATPAEGAERPHWHPGWTQRLADAYALIDEAGETPIVASSLTGRLFASLCFVSSILNEFAPEPIQPAGAADRTRRAGDDDIAAVRGWMAQTDMSRVGRVRMERILASAEQARALEQECATQREDAARLDWIEEHGGSLDGLVPNSDTPVWSFAPWTTHEGYSAREVIDAARAGRPAGEG
jgi:hypothetical protein